MEKMKTELIEIPAYAKRSFTSAGKEMHVKKTAKTHQYGFRGKR
jgi:hypothetical protein